MLSENFSTLPTTFASIPNDFEIEITSDMKWRMPYENSKPNKNHFEYTNLKEQESGLTSHLYIANHVSMPKISKIIK